jgi:hypothetical protein
MRRGKTRTLESNLVAEYVGFFAIFFLPALLVMAVIWFLVRRLSAALRLVILVMSATVLLTPSWGPATIVVVPVPFGFLFVIALFTGEWADLGRWMTLFPIWHSIAFPATAVVSYVIVRLLLSNRSLQPTPDSGAAELRR